MQNLDVYFLMFVVSCIAAVIGYFVKDKVESIVSRIDKLDDSTISEPQARRILEDNLSPLKDDIVEIKSSIRSLTEDLIGVKIKVKRKIKQ